MKNFFYATCLFLILFGGINSIDEEFKIIKLSEIDGKNSYVPLRAGTKFIIEIDGNPDTGKVWFLDSPQLLEYQNLLKPLNLDNYNSADYYQNPNPEKHVGVDGIYHFKFETSLVNHGMATITFIYKYANASQMAEESFSAKILVVKRKEDDL